MIVWYLQAPAASEAINGGASESANGAAAMGARSIDFTLDDKEGLFQVPQHPGLHVSSDTDCNGPVGSVPL